VREVPLESVGNVLTLAKLQSSRGLGRREQIHQGIIADRQLIAYGVVPAGRVSCSVAVRRRSYGSSQTRVAHVDAGDLDNSSSISTAWK
jgi:hypothetical protein